MNKRFLAVCVCFSTFFGSLSALEESDQESIHGIIQGYITVWNEKWEMTATQNTLIPN